MYRQIISKFEILWSRIKNKRIKIHHYKNESGEFDYEQYKEIQTQGNKRKIDKIWAREVDLEFLADYILKNTPNPTFGICHGTRNGFEQKRLSAILNCTVIGTEISTTAQNFENTIQWDFHDENPEWFGRADFVYSNSLDHAYNPKKALTAWMQTLKPDGICIIEHSKKHGIQFASILDPFGAELEIMPFLVLDWSEGKFSVREILENSNHPDDQSRAFLIIKNNC